LSNERIIPQSTEEDSLEELVGSEYYISPEMLESRQSSFASDLWAFGIMIYQFFVGQVPFKGKT
jgi:serine/threonine protein kinase